MKEIVLKVYELSELSPAARERAINEQIQFLNETFDCEELTEQFNEILFQKGYEGLTVRWSLSYSQGDGVAFYGKIDNDQLLKIAERLMNEKGIKRFKRAFNLINEDILIKIDSISNHYNHYNTMKIENETSWYWFDDAIKKYKKSIETIEKLVELMEDDIVLISKELERYGYNEIEYQTSEKAAIESIEANEYYFYKNGCLFG